MRNQRAARDHGPLPCIDLMQTTPRIESLLKRDRAIVISGVVAVVAIAWGYTIYVAQSNADMGTSMGMAMGNVCVGDVGIMPKGGGSGKATAPPETQCTNPARQPSHSRGPIDAALRPQRAPSRPCSH